jgi:hypothetical protein
MTAKNLQHGGGKNEMISKFVGVNRPVGNGRRFTLFAASPQEERGQAWAAPGYFHDMEVIIIPYIPLILFR